MAHINSFDNSDELLVQRWRNGVRLIKPDNFKSHSDKISFIPPSVKKLFEMPFNVYFLNRESVIQNMSDKTASICGFHGIKDAIGNTARAVSRKESAEFSIRHNNEVISRNSVVIKDEHFLRLDDFEFRDISIKFPLLNEEEKIIGVFGCSIILDSPAQALKSLFETGLLGPLNQFDEHQNYLPIYLNPDQHDFNDLKFKLTSKVKQYISKREIECLYFLMKGKSARETGLHLNLSQRTVEYYVNSLKDKLNCAKKSDIIEKVLKLLKN